MDLGTLRVRGWLLCNAKIYFLWKAQCLLVVHYRIVHCHRSMFCVIAYVWRDCYCGAWQPKRSVSNRFPHHFRGYNTILCQVDYERRTSPFSSCACDHAAQTTEVFWQLLLSGSGQIERCRTEQINNLIICFAWVITKRECLHSCALIYVSTTSDSHLSDCGTIYVITRALSLIQNGIPRHGACNKLINKFGTNQIHHHRSVWKFLVISKRCKAIITAKSFE